MPSFNTKKGVEFDIDFEVFCGRCGDGLCNNSSTRLSRNRGEPQVVVNPCQTCLTEERNEGYKEGESEGYAGGHDDGRSEGYDEGHADGFEEGVESCQ